MRLTSLVLQLLQLQLLLFFKYWKIAVIDLRQLRKACLHEMATYTITWDFS